MFLFSICKQGSTQNESKEIKSYENTGDSLGAFLLHIMRSSNYGFNEGDEKNLTVVDLTFGTEGYSIPLAVMSEMVSCFIPSGYFILNFIGSSCIGLKCLMINKCFQIA